MNTYLKKSLLASILTLGTAACANSQVAGQNGENGQNGQNGENGQNGQNGQDSNKDGIDYSNKQIIKVTAIDEPGTDHDDTILVDFASDVSQITDLEGSELTFSYAQRKGLTMDGLGINSVNGHIYAEIYNDVKPGDGIISAGSFFQLGSSAAIAINDLSDDIAQAEKLSRALNKAIGIDDAFMVIDTSGATGFAYINNSYTGYTKEGAIYTVKVMRDIPVANFDKDGNDIGLTLTIPAFTITDYSGSGNRAFNIYLYDGADLMAQAEPEGMEFSLDFLNYQEDCLLEKDGFYLMFNQDMDKTSTELAIKRRLEETPLFISYGATVTVEQVDGYPSSFMVQPSEDIDLWHNVDPAPTYENDYDKFVTCALDLTLEKWDVTNADGITNTNKPITFHITDIKSPELAYQRAHLSDFHNEYPFNSGYQFPYDYDITTDEKSETVQITLATTDADTAKPRQYDGQYAYLENGDFLTIDFTERVQDKFSTGTTTDKKYQLIKEKLLANLEEQKSGSWVKADISKFTSISCNPLAADNGAISSCTVTIPSDSYRMPTSNIIISEEPFANDLVIDSTKGSGGYNNYGIKQQEARPVVANTKNWLVGPSLVSFGKLKTMPVGKMNILAQINDYDQLTAKKPIDNDTGVTNLIYSYTKAAEFFNDRCGSLCNTTGNEFECALCAIGYLFIYGGAISLTQAENQNDALEAYNSLTVVFDKKMNEAVTKEHLAYILGHGKITGGKRYLTTIDSNQVKSTTEVDAFDVAVDAIETTYDSDNRLHMFTINMPGDTSSYYSIKLNDDATEIKFSMAPTDTGIVAMDLTRQIIDVEKPIVIARESFDPPINPKLLSVEGQYNGLSNCGNQLAEAGDTITFKFNFGQLDNTEKIDKNGALETSETFVKQSVAQQVKELIFEQGLKVVGDKNYNTYLSFKNDPTIDDNLFTIEAKKAETNSLGYLDNTNVGYVVTLAADPENEYDPNKPLDMATNRPPVQIDVSIAHVFTFSQKIVRSAWGIAPATKADVTATMAPFDKLAMEMEVLNNVVENDGQFVANDSFWLTFNCPMDDFYTLSAIQEGFDKAVGDGIVHVTRFNQSAMDNFNNSIRTENGYQVSVLPGRSFSAPSDKVLTIEGVATKHDTGDEHANDRRNVAIIDETFKFGLGDASFDDIVFKFVTGSNNGFIGQYKAVAPVPAGIWQLSGQTKGIGRVSTDLPIVFTNE